MGDSRCLSRNSKRIEEIMLKAMSDFMKGVRTLPIGWQVWLMVLVIVNLVIPLFLLGHTEAKWTIAALVGGMIIGNVLVKIQGFTRLLGLMHILWFILIPYLWGRLEFVPASDFFGVWIRSVLVLNGISLVIDISDIVRYIAGDRKSAI